MTKHPQTIRLLGTGALELLQVRIQAVLEAWCKDWCHTQPASDRAYIDVRCLNRKDQASVLEAQWQLFDRMGERISIGMRSEGEKAIAAAMLGIEISLQNVGHALPASVLELAMTDLAQRFLGSAEHRVIAKTPLPEDMEADGRVVLSFLRIGDAELMLLFSPALVMRLVPPRQPKMGGLHSPRICLRSEEVELAARIDLGLIRLGELLELEPGDVLVTCTPLGEPLRLTVGETGPEAATGNLGQIRGRRALVITSMHTTNRSQVLT